MPDVPCAAPFAAAFPGDIHLYVPTQEPPLLGYGALRLLVRCKGRFIIEKQLKSIPPGSKAKCQKVGPTDRRPQ